MTFILLGVGLLAVSATVVAGSRTNKLAKVRERMKTPATPAPAPCPAYFERYMPKRTSGQGEAL